MFSLKRVHRNSIKQMVKNRVRVMCRMEINTFLFCLCVFLYNFPQTTHTRDMNIKRVKRCGLIIRLAKEHIINPLFYPSRGNVSSCPENEHSKYYKPLEARYSAVTLVPPPQQPLKPLRQMNIQLRSKLEPEEEPDELEKQSEKQLQQQSQKQLEQQPQQRSQLQPEGKQEEKLKRRLQQRPQEQLPQQPPPQLHT